MEFQLWPAHSTHPLFNRHYSGGLAVSEPGPARRHHLTQRTCGRHKQVLPKLLTPATWEVQSRQLSTLLAKWDPVCVYFHAKSKEMGQYMSPLDSSLSFTFSLVPIRNAVSIRWFAVSLGNEGVLGSIYFCEAVLTENSGNVWLKYKGWCYLSVTPKLMYGGCFNFRSPGPVETA